MRAHRQAARTRWQRAHLALVLELADLGLDLLYAGLKTLTRLGCRVSVFANRLGLGPATETSIKAWNGAGLEADILEADIPERH